jgi:hypothetical protein
MKSTQTDLQRWLVAFTVAAVLCGCQRPGGNPQATRTDGFVRDLSAHFSAPITSDHEVAVRYEAPDGVGLTNVDVRAVPAWHLQSVLPGRRKPKDRDLRASAA